MTASLDAPVRTAHPYDDTAVIDARAPASTRPSSAW